MEHLLTLPETKKFLSDYPKTKWQTCIEAVYIYGIYCIKRDFPNGLSMAEILKIAGKDEPAKPSLSPSKDQKNRHQIENKSKISTKNLMRIDESSLTEFRNSFETGFGRETKSVGAVVEPKVCSLEVAKRLLRRENKEFEEWLGTEAIRGEIQKSVWNDSGNSEMISGISKYL